jgi:hypothetical protein
MAGKALTPALLKIVEPVLNEMHAGSLQDALTTSFSTETKALATIEECFDHLTSKAHDAEALKRFFQSWSQTNNSATCVAGLACRITLAARNYPDNASQLAYYRVVDSLQRITDEDFGACGEIIHAELYYRMATALCGDDSWLSKGYRNQRAQQFRDWMVKRRLRARDLLDGLLHTLIHEVYTHGEVELIHPVCQAWLPTHLGIPARDAHRILAWITVHTGGTETNHFRHATDAVEGYCEVSGQKVDPVAATELFSAYLRYKAAVMEELIPSLR